MTSSNMCTSKLGDWFKLGSGETRPDIIESAPDGDAVFPVFGGNGVIGWTSKSNADGENIIIGRVGAKCGCVHYYMGKCWITDNALYTKDHKQDYDKPFMAALLSYIGLDRFRSKTGQPLISQGPIHSLKAPIPGINDQQAIALLARTWDTAIEKTEKLIEVKEKRKRDLAYKLLFGKKARTGKRKTAGFLEKPWFSVPDDWRIVKIGEATEEVSIKNQNGNNIPVLSCTKYQGLVDSLKYFDKQIFSEDTSTYKVVDYGQFAYATNHIEEGSIGYQNLYPKGLVSPMYTVFKTDQNMVNDGYLYKLLKTETLRHIFEISTSSSVDRRGSLRWTEFSKLPIPLPSLAEQADINEVLDTAQQEIDLLKKQMEAYRKQKRGLMQKLLTGQWRVGVHNNVE